MERVFRELENDRSVRVQGIHWAAMINAQGAVNKDLDKAISIFNMIPTHPDTRNTSETLPDAVTFEALINVLVAHRRTDLIPQYVEQLKSLGIHMTAYIANCLIRGYAAIGDLEQARLIFDSLLDPAEGMAASNNHTPHEPSSSIIPASAPVYREVSRFDSHTNPNLFLFC
jgi:pentatricopeptide repeat protein